MLKLKFWVTRLMVEVFPSHSREVRSCSVCGFIITLTQLIPVLMASSNSNDVSRLVRQARVSDSDTISLSFFTVEEDRIGTKIGNIHSQMTAMKAVKYDRSQEKPALIEVKSNKYVALEKISGDILVRTRVNREALCTEAGTCCTFSQPVDAGQLSFNLFLEGYSGQLFADCSLRSLILINPREAKFIEVIVYVVDINDNVPQWPMKVLPLDIPEHVALGSRFSLPEAIDPDQGPLHTVTGYRLVVADKNALKELCHGCATDLDHESQNSDGIFTSNLFSLETQLIETSSVGARKFDLTLRVNGDIDREIKSMYYLILYAYDGTEQQVHTPNPAQSWSQGLSVHTRHTGSVNIQINIVDINDHAPVFSEKISFTKIPDNSLPGTVIFRAVAKDADMSDKNKLVYKIGTSASPDVHRYFVMNASNGELKVNRILNYQTAVQLPHVPSEATNAIYPPLSDRTWPSIGYVVPIQVTDGLSQADMQLYVLLQRVNRKAPVLSVASHLKLSPLGDHLWVREDTPPGTLLAIINYDDPDAENLVNLDYKNEQQANTKKPECFTKQDLFEVQSVSSNLFTEFKLTLRKPLDREFMAKHSVTVECWDVGSPPMSSMLSLDIHVEDVDDCPPRFDRSTYTAKITEGLPTNTFITRVHATDADVGENAEVHYRLVQHTVKPARALITVALDGLLLDETKPSVSVNENTGELISQVVFDRESVAAVNCTIEASQQSKLKTNNMAQPRSRHRALTTVIILVEDKNDCQPEFNATSYEFSVLEGHQGGSRIGRVFATDSDASPPNNLIRYSMRPVPGPLGQPAALYLSVSSDGIIYTQKNRLDREQAPILSFEVVAIDGGQPSLTSFASVLVRVLDLNDNAPVWLFPKPGSHSVNTVINVSLYAAVGTKIAHLRAVDVDEGGNGEVTYSILHGNEAGFLEVNSNTGVLSLSKSLAYFPVNNISSAGNGHRYSLTRLTNKTSGEGVYRSEVIHVQRLVLKATDQGQPPRFNTTVMDVAIVNRALSHGSRSSLTRGDRSGQLKGTPDGTSDQRFTQMRWMENDLVVMIVLIVLTSLISMVLLMAICLIRYHRVAICWSRWTSDSNLRRYRAKPGGSTWSNRICGACWSRRADSAYRDTGESQRKRTDGDETGSSIGTSHRYLYGSAHMYSPQRACSLDRSHGGPAGNAELQSFYCTLRPDSAVQNKGLEVLGHVLTPTHHRSVPSHTTSALKNAYLVEVNSHTLDSPPYSILHAKTLGKEYTGVYYQPLQQPPSSPSSQMPILINNNTSEMPGCHGGGSGSKCPDKNTCYHDNRCLPNESASGGGNENMSAMAEHSSVLTFMPKAKAMVNKDSFGKEVAGKSTSLTVEL